MKKTNTHSCFETILIFLSTSTGTTTKLATFSKNWWATRWAARHPSWSFPNRLGTKTNAQFSSSSCKCARWLKQNDKTVPQSCIAAAAFFSGGMNVGSETVCAEFRSRGDDFNREERGLRPISAEWFQEWDSNRSTNRWTKLTVRHQGKCQRNQA